MGIFKTCVEEAFTAFLQNPALEEKILLFTAWWKKRLDYKIEIQVALRSCNFAKIKGFTIMNAETLVLKESFKATIKHGTFLIFKDEFGKYLRKFS